MHLPVKQTKRRVIHCWIAKSLAGRIHQDQRGAMSFVTLFTVLMLAMLLGMILNVCKIADEKIRMQNAVDASIYSSGIIMARGMNSLAFTNHLLCDVFALTAFLRIGGLVADTNNSDAPDDLALNKNSAFENAGANWPTDARGSGQSYKLPNLPQRNWDGLPEGISHGATQNKVMIETFSAWVNNFSNEVLPSLEEILKRKLIPEFQSHLVKDVRSMVEQTAQRTALRNLGEAADSKESETAASIWKTDGADPKEFGQAENDSDAIPAGLPVVDANSDKNSFYPKIARAQRKRLAENYLAQWNREKTLAFDGLDGMSNFTTIWRNFTRKELEKLLLEEHPNSNLLHVIWTPLDIQSNQSLSESEKEDLRPYVSFNYTRKKRNELIRDCYTFIGVLKKKQFRPFMPSLFTNPLSGKNRMTFAQGMLYIPIPRLVRETFPEPCCKTTIVQPEIRFNQGAPSIKRGTISSHIEYSGRQIEGITRQSRAMEWNLLNQGWQFKLCPAQCDGLNMILAKNNDAIKNLPDEDIKHVNTH